jgi:hypothetical protein
MNPLLPFALISSWWYYDTGIHQCAPGVSPAEMVHFIENMGQTPRVRYDGKRILVMKNTDDTQGLIFYQSKTDCEEDGRT